MSDVALARCSTLGMGFVGTTMTRLEHDGEWQDKDDDESCKNLQ